MKGSMTALNPYSKMTINELCSAKDDKIEGAQILAQLAAPRLPDGLGDLTPQSALEQLHGGYGSTEPMTREMTDVLILLLRCHRTLQDLDAAEHWRAKYIAEAARADAEKARADALDELRKTEAKYEKAQVLALKLQGACHARGMLENIQDDIVLQHNFPSNHLKTLGGARSAWGAMFHSNPLMLQAAKDSGVRPWPGQQQPVKTPDHAAMAMTAIYDRLSTELHDRRTAIGYQTSRDVVVIPTNVLTGGQARLLLAIGSYFRFPCSFSEDV